MLQHLTKTTAVTAERVRGESGMATAEYAVGTVTACGFAGMLYTLLTSDFGQSLLQNIFDKVTSSLPF